MAAECRGRRPATIGNDPERPLASPGGRDLRSRAELGGGPSWLGDSPRSTIRAIEAIPRRLVGGQRRPRRGLASPRSRAARGRQQAEEALGGAPARGHPDHHDAVAVGEQERRTASPPARVSPSCAQTSASTQMRAEPDHVARESRRSRRRQALELGGGGLAVARPAGGRARAPGRLTRAAGSLRSSSASTAAKAPSIRGAVGEPEPLAHRLHMHVGLLGADAASPRACARSGARRPRAGRRSSPTARPSASAK